jgi:galactokinase
MKLKMVLAGALVAGFVLPVAAQAETYYVVHDAKTKHCTIVDQKPVTTETTTVDADGVGYKTRTEAESAMKTIKVCTTE